MQLKQRSKSDPFEYAIEDKAVKRSLDMSTQSRMLFWFVFVLCWLPSQLFLFSDSSASTDVRLSLGSLPLVLLMLWVWMKHITDARTRTLVLRIEVLEARARQAEGLEPVGAD